MSVLDQAILRLLSFLQMQVLLSLLTLGLLDPLLDSLCALSSMLANVCGLIFFDLRKFLHLLRLCHKFVQAFELDRLRLRAAYTRVHLFDLFHAFIVLIGLALDVLVMPVFGTLLASL